jgi:uncharacterized protein (DUF427 family)
MKAIWNGEVLAESDDTVVIEGNHYFPASTLKKEFIKETDTHTVCPWKGTASYYSLSVNGKENQDAVWYDPTPSELAKGIKDHVTFWKGVQVEK